jgi:hypothetical protein
MCLPNLKKQVTVLIPIHQEIPSELEQISLAQTLKVLHKYPITFQAKHDLNIQWYEDFCEGKAEVIFERFKWSGFQQYTHLMISPEFYKRFLHYEYILICHLDAFVFRDELQKWCDLDYDYIGSVIYNKIWTTLPNRSGKLLGLTRPEYFGNGGFALRKVDAFHNLTTTFYFKIKLYLWYKRIRQKFFLDDIFLSQLFPSLMSTFKIPPKSIAQQFGAAFEIWDDRDLPFTKGDCSSLPFGIHGWFKHNFEYWKPCIREHGHII